VGNASNSDTLTYHASDELHAAVRETIKEEKRAGAPVAEVREIALALTDHGPAWDRRAETKAEAAKMQAKALAQLKAAREKLNETGDPDDSILCELAE